MAGATTYRLGRLRIPRWGMIAINIVAPFIGVGLGVLGIDLFFSPPDVKAKIGPLRPGQERAATVAWPQGNFTGGQLSMILDVGANRSIANNIVVNIDLVDPEDAAKTYQLARIEKFDTPRNDGLVYASKIVNLIPPLTNLRGAVRQFNARQVQVRAKVQPKPKAPDSTGFVFVTDVRVIGKPAAE